MELVAEVTGPLSRVPDFLLILIGLATSRIVSRLPKKARGQYKDIVALLVAVGITVGLWAVGYKRIDIVAAYQEGIRSTIWTAIATGGLAWAASILAHLAHKGTGSGENDDSVELPGVWDNTLSGQAEPDETSGT